MPLYRKEPITPEDRAYNTRNTPSIQKEWIEAIIANGSNDLTTWEIDFIESIEKFLNNNRPLSEKQSEILERIYNKI